MASEERKGKRQRIFVAVDLPDEIRDGLRGWGEAELVDPALRPVLPESLHVTLVFLGYREADEVETIGEAVREVSAPAPLMKLEDPISLPRRRRAALFALPAPSPATTDLHHRVAGKLVDLGLHEPEDRDFWPHVTVARVRPEGRGSRRPAAVTRRPGAAQGAVLCRPIDALPFCTPAGGLSLCPAGPSRAVLEGAAEGDDLRWRRKK